jgi:hypothetical protein
MRKFYSKGVSNTIEWKEYKSLILYFFNDLKLFIDTFEYEFSPIKNEVSNNFSGEIIAKDREDFILLLESELDKYSEFKNRLYFSDLIKCIQNKTFDLKIFVGKQDKYNKDKFLNPLTFFSELLIDNKINLINNNQTKTCLIEDPYLNDDEVIKSVGNLLNVDSLIILESVKDKNKKISKKKIDDKNVYIIPITKHFKGGELNDNKNYSNRFHDRNIITNDYWINLGNSFRTNNFYTQTQLFLNPNIINLEFIKYKIQGSVNLINQHCPQLKECKIDVFDFNRRFNLNDINLIFDKYVKLFDFILKKDIY